MSRRQAARGRAAEALRGARKPPAQRLLADAASGPPEAGADAQPAGAGRPSGAQAAPIDPAGSAVSLVRAVFLSRYRRFLADVELDGRRITVHVPNTGSMATLLAPGVDAWLRPAATAGRKLAWTLVMLGLPGGGLALIDTGMPNRLVAAAARAGRIPAFAGFGTVRCEAAIDDRSRCDLLLTADGADGPRLWVEIKNCTQAGARPGRCDFPDAVTARGAKHLDALAARVAAGDRAIQFYLLSRTDCDRIGIARSVDPAYAAAVARARAAGVEFVAHRAELAPDRQALGAAVPVDLDG